MSAAQPGAYCDESVCAVDELVDLKEEVGEGVVEVLEFGEERRLVAWSEEVGEKESLTTMMMMMIIIMTITTVGSSSVHDDDTGDYDDVGDRDDDDVVVAAVVVTALKK